MVVINILQTADTYVQTDSGANTGSPPQDEIHKNTSSSLDVVDPFTRYHWAV